jgi:hypothetical protein
MNVMFSGAIVSSNAAARLDPGVLTACMLRATDPQG